MVTESPIAAVEALPVAEPNPEPRGPVEVLRVPPQFGAPRPEGLQVERELGRLDGPRDGGLLVAVAGIHGNEPAGVRGLERVFRKLEAEQGTSELLGRFVALAGNLPALARSCRYLDRDLNRIWTPAELARARQHPETVEDKEMVALADRLAHLLGGVPEERRRHVCLLDLHTASGPGPAFTVFDDTLPNRAYALELEAPVVLGIEEELAGTLMHHVSELGFTAVGFEGGRHEDPGAVDRCEAAVWVSLGVAGVLPQDHPQVVAARRGLREASDDLPRVVEVLYRHALEPGDGFEICPGVRGFQEVRDGEVVGHDHQGPVRVRGGGLVLMPLYQEQGEEAFFLVRPVQPGWLAVSRWMRRRRLERWLHWLPGVKRHPTEPGRFIVDRRVARWVAVQIFHLLGFRREGPAGGRYLVMSRRVGDRVDEE